MVIFRSLIIMIITMMIQMIHDQPHHHHLGITEDGHADGRGEHPDKGNVAARLENMMVIRWRRGQVDGGDYDVVDDGDDDLVQEDGGHPDKRHTRLVKTMVRMVVVIKRRRVMVMRMVVVMVVMVIIRMVKIVLMKW